MPSTLVAGVLLALGAPAGWLLARDEPPAPYGGDVAAALAQPAPLVVQPVPVEVAPAPVVEVPAPVVEVAPATGRAARPRPAAGGRRAGRPAGAA